MNDSLMKVLKLELFKSGDIMEVPVTKVLCDLKTPFQHVVIADSDKFGRCLVIDDVMQMSMSDHDIYDSELLRKLRLTDKKILILGGGDGFVAKKILSSNPKASIIIVDLDIEVIKAVKKHFDQDVFDSKQVTLLIGDALGFMEKQIGGGIDGVICDLTDSPVGAQEESAYARFYGEVFSKAASILNDNGWISVQSGASEVTKGYIDQVSSMKSLLEKNFSSVERTDVLVPSYGELCAFLFAEKPKK